jgi:HAD superfamily hydrolase (TIGR01509 family)
MLLVKYALGVLIVIIFPYNNHVEEEKLKAIIFDFDGTIADTLPLAIEIALKLNDTLKLFKKEEVNIEEFRNMSSRDFIKRLNMPKYKLIYYFWKSRRMLGGKIENVPVFGGIKETLEKLHSSGIKLAVVTSNSGANARKFLISKNIDVFDIVESPLFVFNKARVIEKVMKKLNVKPEDTAYVGDETRDIESAHKAGVKSVAVTWGYHFRDLLVRFKPNYVVDKPEELLGLI